MFKEDFDKLINYLENKLSELEKFEEWKHCIRYLICDLKVQKKRSTYKPPSYNVKTDRLYEDYRRRSSILENLIQNYSYSAYNPNGNFMNIMFSIPDEEIHKIKGILIPNVEEHIKLIEARGDKNE